MVTTGVAKALTKEVKFKYPDGRGFDALRFGGAKVKSYNVKVMYNDEDIYSQYASKDCDFSNEDINIILIKPVTGTAVINLKHIKDKKKRNFIKNNELELLVNFSSIGRIVTCINGFVLVKSDCVDVKQINKLFEG